MSYVFYLVKWIWKKHQYIKNSNFYIIMYKIKSGTLMYWYKIWWDTECKGIYKNNQGCCTYPKYAWNILFCCMNYIGVSHRTHRKLFIPHIKDLRNIHWRQCITVRRDIIKEKLEITHHNKLTHPAFLDPTCLWHLYITFIGCTNTSCWINTKRSFCCK